MTAAEAQRLMNEEKCKEIENWLANISDVPYQIDETDHDKKPTKGLKRKLQTIESALKRFKNCLTECYNKLSEMLTTTI